MSIQEPLGTVELQLHAWQVDDGWLDPLVLDPVQALRVVHAVGMLVRCCRMLYVHVRSREDAREGSQKKLTSPYLMIFYNISIIF